jgi:membrane protease YdiL (CAAX protease family)
VYGTVFTSLSATSGIAYNEWFATGANAWRSAVLPLAAGAAVLIAFLLRSRWDGIFRDPERLPMRRFYWVVVGLFTLGILLHLLFVQWQQLTVSLLVAILVAGVLVGFCEEVLFRGILLRALRTHGHAEFWVVLVTSVLFGAFHLANVLNGSSWNAALSQMGIAAASGVALYLFRRGSGLLLPAMIAHGLWDISVFLPSNGDSAGQLISLGVSATLTFFGVVVVLVSLAHDRHMVITQKPRS